MRAVEGRDFLATVVMQVFDDDHVDMNEHKYYVEGYAPFGYE